MSLLSDSLNQLAGNIFGSQSLRTAPGVRLQKTPTSILGNDPFAFTTLSYPRDVTQDMANGHYMLFYVYVQNKTKYKYDVQDGTQVGETVIRQVPSGPAGQTKEEVFFNTNATEDASYRQ